MTNEEAIERLQSCKRNLELGKVIGAVSEEGANERIEAYDLAIKALEFINENYPKTFIDYLNGEQI